MRKFLGNMIMSLLGMAWALTHMLLVVCAAEFLIGHFKKGRE